MRDMREHEPYEHVIIGKTAMDLSTFFALALAQSYDEKRVPKASELVEGLDYYIRSKRRKRYNFLNTCERFDVVKVANNMRMDIMLLFALFMED